MNRVLKGGLQKQNSWLSFVELHNFLQNKTKVRSLIIGFCRMIRNILIIDDRKNIIISYWYNFQFRQFKKLNEPLPWKIVSKVISLHTIDGWEGLHDRDKLIYSSHQSIVYEN